MPPLPERHVVYAELTHEEHARFERIRQQEHCTRADLIRMALDEFAKRYGFEDAFTIKDYGHKPKGV